MSTIITPFQAGTMMGKFEQLVDDFPDVFPVKTLGVSFTKEFLTEFMSLNCSTVTFFYGIDSNQRLTLVLEKFDGNSLSTGAASPNGGGGSGSGQGNGGVPIP